MPIIKSAIKRMRQTKVKSLRNSITKKLLKETLKSFISLVEAGENAEAIKLYPVVQKKIDLAVKKNLWHANKAARVKSRYAKMLKADAKPAKKEVTTKKPAVKKEEE
jgi:small subunit ribosomal protein S20